MYNNVKYKYVKQETVKRHIITTDKHSNTYDSDTHIDM